VLQKDYDYTDTLIYLKIFVVHATTTGVIFIFRKIKLFYNNLYLIFKKKLR